MEQAMKRSVTIDNLKCSGCATTIVQSLGHLSGVFNVDVDIDHSIVNVEANDRAFIAAKQKLDQLGYPESGTASGLHGAVATAKSYLSCAIGRFGTAGSSPK
jgi:copper chaperone